MTHNWHLKSFSHQYHIPKTLESVFIIIIFSSQHSSNKLMCCLSEIEVSTHCRKKNSASWKGEVSFSVTVGELTYLYQQEIQPQIWLSAEISVCWFGFRFLEWHSSGSWHWGLHITPKEEEMNTQNPHSAAAATQ